MNKENEKLKQALKKIKEIIKDRFEKHYMELGIKETDEIIEDIHNIVNGALDE